MSNHRVLHLSLLLLGLGPLGGAAFGCSSDEDSGPGIDGSVAGRSPGGATSGGAGGLGTGGSSGLTGVSGDGTGATAAGSSMAGAAGSGGSRSTMACSGLPFDAAAGEGGAGIEACTGTSVEAEAIPVDLYLMVDRSSSMSVLVTGTNTTRWDALHEAVEEFVTSPSFADVRMGIGFFNRTGGNDDLLDCNVDYYATPRVEIGALSDVGADIVAAIGDTVPGGLTPTIPALQGALDHAAAWSADNPDRATAVVLVTDGYPTQCPAQASVSEVSAVARAAHENAPFTRTFVVGVGAEFNLDSIADSGGTRQAYLVDDADVAASFAETLRNITASPLACEYEIPPPDDANMQIDPERVQVVYTPTTGDAEEVPRIDGEASCPQNPNGGWYYDDPQQPTRIRVCPCTCQRFAAGRVDVRLGCRPRIGIR